MFSIKFMGLVIFSMIFFHKFLDCASLKNYGKTTKNIPMFKKYDAKYWANKNLKITTILELHKQLFHISQHRAQGDQQKLWELGQQQAMVHPRNCSSSNIRFIGLFYSCLAGKLGRDLVAAAG